MTQKNKLDESRRNAIAKLVEQIKEEIPTSLLQSAQDVELCHYIREHVQIRIINSLAPLFLDELFNQYWIDRWCANIFKSRNVYLSVCEQAANLIYLNLMDAFELNNETKEVMNISFKEFITIAVSNTDKLRLTEKTNYFVREHNSNLLAWLSIQDISAIVDKWIGSIIN